MGSNGMFSSHTLKICEEPTRKSNKKFVTVKNYLDTYPISLDKCPTGWFFVKDFYGHSGWVRMLYNMRIIND